MNFRERLEPSPNNAMFGTVLIKGTKISVRRILKELSEGKTIDEMQKIHSEIKIDDILACLEYASELTGAINYNNSMAAIDNDIKKRYALADKIRSMGKNPPPSWG